MSIWDMIVTYYKNCDLNASLFLLTEIAGFSIHFLLNQALKRYKEGSRRKKAMIFTFSIFLVALLLFIPPVANSYKRDYFPLPISHITSTDTITKPGYDAQKAIDGLTSTSWQFNALNEAATHALYIKLDNPYHVSSLEIYNGGEHDLGSSTDPYRRNGKVKDVRIRVRYENSAADEYEIIGYYTLENRALQETWDTLPIETNGKVTDVMLEVISFYNDGTDNPYDVAISEIKVWGYVQ